LPRDWNMKNSIFAFTLILGSLFSLTCSEMVDEERPLMQADLKKLCDGSDDIVLRIRSETPRLGPGDLLFYENGRSYFYLTGKCEFWSGLETRTEKNLKLAGPMVSRIRKGSFDEENGLKFLKLLRMDRWGELDGVYFNYLPNTHAGISIIKTRTLSFAITEPGDPEAYRKTEIGKTYFRTVEGLSNATAFARDFLEPIEKGPLRIFVAETLYDDYWARAEHPPIFVDWPLDVSVLELSKQQNPYCYGRSFLVTGDDAEVFWNAREKYTREVATTFPLLMGVEDESGGKHEIYIRSVLPFENELGLVPLDGNFNGDSCQ